MAFEAAVRAYIDGLRFEPRIAEIVAEELHRQFRQRTQELSAAAEHMSRAADDLRAERAETVRAFKAATSDAMRRALEADIERLDGDIARGSQQHRRSSISAPELDDFIRELAEIMEHPSILLENPENPRVQQTRYRLTFEPLPTLAEIENGTAKLSPIFSLCEGEEDTKSVQVRLSGLTWNQIEREITRWKSHGA